MPFLYWDWTLVVLIPAAIFAMVMQARINSTYAKYYQMPSVVGMTAGEVAAQILMASGINDVKIERIPGRLTDHYDPRTLALRLSDGVYNSSSIAAIGVAAHEAGHAIQHNEGYTPLGVRNAIVPVARIGSTLSIPLIFIGLFLASSPGAFGPALINIGIILFELVVAFQIITLPVEFNASKRALELLSGNHFLNQDELVCAKKVLNAAAMTYVASVAVALSQLLRLLLLSNSRRRD